MGMILNYDFFLDVFCVSKAVVFVVVFYCFVIKIAATKTASNGTEQNIKI